MSARLALTDAELVAELLALLHIRWTESLTWRDVETSTTISMAHGLAATSVDGPQTPYDGLTFQPGSLDALRRNAERIAVLYIDWTDRGCPLPRVDR